MVRLLAGMTLSIAHLKLQKLSGNLGFINNNFMQPPRLMAMLKAIREVAGGLSNLLNSLLLHDVQGLPNLSVVLISVKGKRSHLLFRLHPCGEHLYICEV